MQINTTITAGTSLEFQELADFFRILAAQSTVDLVFYSNGARVASASAVGAGYAEKFSQPFDKVVITSATTQTIQLVSRFGNEVRYDTPPTGSVQVTNTPAVTVSNTPAVTVANMPTVNVASEAFYTYGASFASTAIMAANTPQTIVAPAANVNGMIVWDAGFSDWQTANGHASIVAKSAAPTTVSDGDVITQSDAGGPYGTNFVCGSLKRAVKIPAGKGLYYIQNGTTNLSIRHVNYTLL